MHNVKEQRIKTLLRRTKGENTEILFHHRYSTSTPDVRNACHPFSTKDAFDHEYIGVHNGVIGNADELKKEHVKLGIEYVSNQPEDSLHRIRFNDSEALVYDLARYFEGDVDKLTAKGNDAFVVIRMNAAGQPKTLFFGHNTGSPLRMKKTKNNIVVSSLGAGEEVLTDTLFMFDYETGILSSEPMNIPTAYSYEPYKHSAPSYAPRTSDPARNAKASHSHSSTASRSFHSPQDPETDEEWREWSETRYGRAVNEAYTRAGFSDDEDEPVTDEEQAQINEAIANLNLEDEEKEMLQLNLQDFPQADNRQATNPGTISLEKFYGYDSTNNFVILPGDKTSVQASFLKSSSTVHDALVKARGAQSDAMDELNRLNNIVKHVANSEVEKIIDYYGLIADYVTMLSEICDNFKNAAQRFADKEDVGKSEFGFQVPAHTS